MGDGTILTKSDKGCPASERMTGTQREHSPRNTREIIPSSALASKGIVLFPDIPSSLVFLGVPSAKMAIKIASLRYLVNILHDVSP